MLFGFIMLLSVLHVFCYGRQFGCQGENDEFPSVEGSGLFLQNLWTAFMLYGMISVGLVVQILTAIYLVFVRTDFLSTKGTSHRQSSLCVRPASVSQYSSVGNYPSTRLGYLVLPSDEELLCWLLIHCLMYTFSPL